MFGLFAVPLSKDTAPTLCKFASLAVWRLVLRSECRETLVSLHADSRVRARTQPRRRCSHYRSHVPSLAVAEPRAATVGRFTAHSVCASLCYHVPCGRLGCGCLVATAAERESRRSAFLRRLSLPPSVWLRLRALRALGISASVGPAELFDSI